MLLTKSFVKYCQKLKDGSADKNHFNHSHQCGQAVGFNSAKYVLFF